MRVLIRPAGRNELAGIRELLASQNLPHERFEERLSHLLVAQSEGTVVGCIGLELLDRMGIIRVLAVKPDLQGEDIDRQLIEHILDYARLANIEEVYAFTSSLSPYLEELGFKVINRDELPSEIKELPDLNVLYPETVLCLRMKIKRITELE